MPDKEGLYGEFLKWNRKRLEWQGSLARKAAHKALDIADDENVDINATTTNHHYPSGIGKALLLAGGMATLGAGLAAPTILDALRPTAVVPVEQPVQPAPQPAPVVPDRGMFDLDLLPPEKP